MLLAALAAAAVLLGGGAAAAGPARGGGARNSPSGEVELSSDEFTRLDTFEAHTLQKGDDAFAAKQYRRAFAEYEAFILTFSRSRALPYAVLRKGRCLHLDDKRFDAVKWYKEVLDYWPDEVKYAAAAKFYIGQCHWQNGQEEDAMRVWAELADDAEYSKHPLAAAAVNHLADYLAKQEQPEKAGAYWRQVAVDFRTKNPSAASHAIGKAVEFHVRGKPDEPALRDLYEKAGTFDSQPRRIRTDLATSKEYWDLVRGLVRRHGQFDADQAELAERYYAYWAKALDGKFPEDDAYQIDVADFRLRAEKDTAKWMERLDRQFETHQKPGDWGRIVRWIALYARDKPKAMKYYEKLDLGRMKNEDLESLMAVLFDQVGDAPMARNVFEKLRLEEMPDDRKTALARYLWQRDEGCVKAVCRRFTDPVRGKMELLRYYHSRRDAGEGLKLAAELVGAAAYAAEARTLKAELHEAAKEWAEALAEWQQLNSPPATSWRIADCYFRLGKLEQAVGELRSVERFFPDSAAEACLRVAFLYDKAGAAERSVAVFHEVMHKYPKTGQSSRAHHELERRGVTRIGGGQDDKEPRP